METHSNKRAETGEEHSVSRHREALCTPPCPEPAAFEEAPVGGQANSPQSKDLVRDGGLALPCGKPSDTSGTLDDGPFLMPGLPGGISPDAFARKLQRGMCSEVGSPPVHAQASCRVEHARAEQLVAERPGIHSELCDATGDTAEHGSWAGSEQPISERAVDILWPWRQLEERLQSLAEKERCLRGELTEAECVHRLAAEEANATEANLLELSAAARRDVQGASPVHRERISMIQDPGDKIALRVRVASVNLPDANKDWPRLQQLREETALQPEREDSAPEPGQWGHGHADCCDTALTRHLDHSACATDLFALRPQDGHVMQLETPSSPTCPPWFCTSPGFRGSQAENKDFCIPDPAWRLQPACGGKDACRGSRPGSIAPISRGSSPSSPSPSRQRLPERFANPLVPSPTTATLPCSSSLAASGVQDDVCRGGPQDRLALLELVARERERFLAGIRRDHVG